VPDITLQLRSDGSWLAVAYEKNGSAAYDGSGRDPLTAMTQLAQGLQQALNDAERQLGEAADV